MTERRSFLGIAWYNGRFIKRFANLSVVLHACTSVKNKEFLWMEEHEVAFIALKEKLMSSPVLAYPLFDSPFIDEKD